MEINIKEFCNDAEIEYREGKCIPHFVFPAFERTGLVEHLFTTRLGGESTGYFSTLNLSFTRGDEDEKVTENFRRVAAELGCDISDFCFSDQTHTVNLRVITEADRGAGITKERTYKNIDGIMTDLPGIVLSTFYADCVPLYFLDPVKHAIALSHSGWKGTVGRIGQLTVQKMVEVYGSDPSDILCAIAPSICVDCYEVSRDVAERFVTAFDIKEIPEWTGHGDMNYILYKKSEDKYQLNLWKACYDTLLAAGIRSDHISLTNVCTCCNPDLLFSHRASQGKRGNLGAFLMLKP